VVNLILEKALSYPPCIWGHKTIKFESDRFDLELTSDIAAARAITSAPFKYDPETLSDPKKLGYRGFEDVDCWFPRVRVVGESVVCTERSAHNPDAITCGMKSIDRITKIDHLPTTSSSIQTRPRDSHDLVHVFEEAITLLSSHDSGGLETTSSSQRRQVRDLRSSHELRVIPDSIFRDPTGCLERKLGNLPAFPSKSNESYFTSRPKKKKAAVLITGSR
jgi:hypothetical protein